MRNITWLPSHGPWLGIKSTVWAYALTRNKTCHLFVYRNKFQPTEPYGPGISAFILPTTPKYLVLLLNHFTYVETEALLKLTCLRSHSWLTYRASDFYIKRRAAIYSSVSYKHALSDFLIGSLSVSHGLGI